MSYDYIKRHYKIEVRVKSRVRHKVTKRYGEVRREDRSASHYVQVRFDGDSFALPCHPNELDYKLCSICSRPLDVPNDPTTKDCGGDCLRCMAESGDPECVAAMESLKQEKP